jgi:hypothetical protein
VTLTPSRGAPTPPPRSGSTQRPSRAPHRRERDRILAQTPEIHGLLPLLMKQRNGARWEDGERHDLHWRLRRLVHVSPYLMILLVPGSIVFLPLIARWLDRREARRKRV